MTPSERARQDAEWDAFQDLLRGDPGMADYLDNRSARARRVLGLPVLVTPEERAALAWEAEQAERCYEQPSMWGVMDG